MFMLRCSVSNDIELLMGMLMVLARPVAEFCSYVWFPSLKGNTEYLESTATIYNKLYRLKSVA